MSKGIYTAVSGAIAQSTKLDTIANNLANVNTPGFKRDAQIFQEYLSAYEKEAPTVEVPRVPASIESFYNMQGGDKSYVDVKGSYTDFQQGFLKQTGNPLDLAIEGQGFFEVLTPEGVRLTRAGHFNVDSEGRLVTPQGFLVLKEAEPGADPQTRAIRLENADVSISQNGEIFSAKQSVGKLSLIDVQNKDALLKSGASVFSLKDNLDPKMIVAQEAKVHQGSLEGSNVNTVTEMVEMLKATRTFESTQKAIQAYDEMQRRLVNDVPKLNQG